MPAARFVEAAVRELPRERDEQIADAVLGRASTALTLYLASAEAAAVAPAWERLLLARADDAALPYGMRKASLDALAATVRTDAGRTALRDFLAERRKFDGKAVQQPTRWSMVGALLALGEPNPEALIAAETARDTSSEGARRAFVAGRRATSWSAPSVFAALGHCRTAARSAGGAGPQQHVERDGEHDREHDARETTPGSELDRHASSW